MRNMSRNPLIKRYYDEVKHQYDITEDQFFDIVFTAFKYFRSRMNSEEIPDIRIKGFGSFQVFSTPVKYELKKLAKMVEQNKANEFHFNRIKILNEYVEKNKVLFKENTEKGDTPK
jgi:nucleoid DNA-binding protein